MPYKPRAGALRKLKYPLRIYKESEIPKKDLAEVRELGKRIRKEEDLDECCNGKYQNDARRPFKLHKGKAEADTEKSRTHNLLTGSLVLPQAEVSLAPVDIYENVDNSMPPFPLKACPDPVCSSDSEYDEYEYDMDSEDEEWLNANKGYCITPARLEFIFSKLNQRDTHVPSKAIGALPEQVHSDFPHVFPYWKSKRLQNKNISSLRHKSVANPKEEKSSSGYISTDPCLTFVGKVPKRVLPSSRSEPQLSTLQKIEKKMGMKLDYSKLIELQEKLIHLRSWSKQEIQNGFDVRDRVRSNIEAFEQSRYQENLDTGRENQEPLTSSVSSTTRGAIKRLSSRNKGRQLQPLEVKNKISYGESTAKSKPQVIQVLEVEPRKQTQSRRKSIEMATFEQVVGGTRDKSKKIRNMKSTAPARKVISGRILRIRSLEREM